jgi:CRP-like cAMP-binding protein
MEQLQKYFATKLELTDEEWELLFSILSYEKVPKKTKLLDINETENFVSFIETGIVRLYIPKTKNDLTFCFAFKNSFICAYDSFLTQLPSTYIVETVTDTVIWRIAYDDLQSIYNNTQIGNTINTISRIATEEMYLLHLKRELSLLNDSAEERYLKLFSEEPELIHKVPLKYIASYIGVTPQALSRIRNRIY